MCFTREYKYYCGKNEFIYTRFCDDALWFHSPYGGWFQFPCGDNLTIPIYDTQKCFRCYLTGSHDESDDDESPAYHAYPDAYHAYPVFDMESEHGALSVRSDDEDLAPAVYYDGVPPEEPADLDADADANAEADDSDSLYDSDAENDASTAPGYDPTRPASLPDTESDYDAAAAPTYDQGYLPTPHVLAHIQARLMAQRAEGLSDEEYREQEELADEEYTADQFDEEYDSDQYP